jgi:hypothetical protein
MLPLIAFRMAWHATGWVNTWACEEYRRSIGFSPTGASVESLPFNPDDLPAVLQALQQLREKRDRSPVMARWRYPTVKGEQTFDSICHPVEFDEEGKCCEVFGIFAPTTEVGRSLKQEILARWLAAQPSGLLEYIVKYATPQLDGSLLRLEFECEAYAQVVECQRDRLVESPPTLPPMQVICCCKECLAV